MTQSEEVRLRQGRYVLQGILGEGAQGTTFVALDLQRGQPVAIKRFEVGGARSWKDVELAEREARVLATLDHPYLPHYIEHFEENGVLYLVMEKVDGETLESIRRRVGPLPEAEVRRFLACADSAFTYLHGRASPVVHRDVKPRNVIRRPDGSYVFVDFGTVSERMRPQGGSTVVGTYGYMAPEQLQGRALPCTDVYAIGATAVAALAGVEPEALPHRGLRIDVHEVLRGRASPAMIAALVQMLEPDPDRRPSRVASALASSPRAAVPQPLATSSADAREEATVRSIRKLLWAVWGIGWVVVPAIAEARRWIEPNLVPAIMFGWLALNIILGWNKAALIRIALRAFREELGETRTASATPMYEAPPAPAMQMRLGLPTQDHRLRVQTSDPRFAEPLGDTQVSPVSPLRAQHR